MIAQEARIEHPLIHYYFGSKEKLYDAVCEVLYEDFAVANRTWLEGLDKTLPKTGLPIYLDKLIDYTYRNPEPLMLISLNMSQFGSNEEIPGFRYLHLHMERVRQTVEEKIPLAGPKEEIRMFIYCLNNLVINLLGPRRTQAMLLNMDPDGPEYRQWVKDAMLKLFLPWLTELIFPPKKD